VTRRPCPDQRGAVVTATQRETRLREALAAHDRRWVLVPLAGKRPISADWPNAPRQTVEQLRRWVQAGFNLGVLTGQRSGGLFVVDVDAAKGGNAAALDLPKTVTCLTGGGGLHVYLRNTAMALGNSVGNLGPHIDTRGDGGQVVLPGSTHPDTGIAYAWAEGLSPDDLEIAPPAGAAGPRSDVRRFDALRLGGVAKGGGACELRARWVAQCRAE